MYKEITREEIAEFIHDHCSRVIVDYYTIHQGPEGFTVSCMGEYTPVLNDSNFDRAIESLEKAVEYNLVMER